MKKRIIIITILILMSASQGRAGLDQLIEQNVRDSEAAYRQVVIDTEPEKKRPRLWIHARSDAQKAAVEEIRGWLGSIEMKGNNIDLHPVQLVDYGPNRSDLRFFKHRDAARAKKLHEKLSEIIPDLKLVDMSRQYRNVDWIEPGHFELWLAPDLTRLVTPD